MGTDSWGCPTSPEEDDEKEVEVGKAVNCSYRFKGRKEKTLYLAVCG